MQQKLNYLIFAKIAKLDDYCGQMMDKIGDTLSKGGYHLARAMHSMKCKAHTHFKLQPSQLASVT